MKKARILSLVIAIILCASIFSSVVYAISVYNNNTDTTSTGFFISESGLATVYTSYSGWEGIMTDATITITIKKRSFLLFWNEVTTKTLYSTQNDYSNTFEYQLTEKGTYKCEVEYIVSGTGGEDDVIPFEDTVTY